MPSCKESYTSYVFFLLLKTYNINKENLDFISNSGKIYGQLETDMTRECSFEALNCQIDAPRHPSKEKGINLSSYLFYGWEFVIQTLLISFAMIYDSK